MRYLRDCDLIYTAVRLLGQIASFVRSVTRQSNRSLLNNGYSLPPFWRQFANKVMIWRRYLPGMPSNPQGHWWSYRLIDGRKCWYEGKPMLSKSLLEWPKEASAQPDSSSEVTSVVTEKPGNPLDSQAWAPKDSVLISLENLHAFELRHVGPWLTFPSQAQGV